MPDSATEPEPVMIAPHEIKAESMKCTNPDAGRASGTAAAIRSASSPAARLEKGEDEDRGGIDPSEIRHVTRFTSVRVLPVPGPAWTWNGEPRWAAARSCEGSGRGVVANHCPAPQATGGVGRSRASKICCRTRFFGSPVLSAIADAPEAFIEIEPARKCAGK